MNRLLDFNHPLTNVELEELCRLGRINLIGVFMKDEVPSKLVDGCYIVNLESKNEDGSHWCCFIKYKNTVYWADPFGQPPPQYPSNVFKKNKLKCLYCTDQVQSIDSILCGYYCIGFFIYVLNKNIITKWNKLFNKDIENNDVILKKYIMEYYNNIHK